MSLQIKGGLTGRIADVTLRNTLRTLATSISGQHAVTIKDRRCWTAQATVTPTGANDFFFYFRNTGTNDLVITRLSAQATTIDRVLLHRVTGTSVGGTTLTPNNRFVGSGRVPTATIQTGVDITGLTATDTYERLVVTANANNTIAFNDRPVLLPNGESVALLAITGTIAITFQLDFYVQLNDPLEF